MTQVRVYHNPRCSKSREALALLEARGVACQIIEYLKNPPSLLALRTLLDTLGVECRALIRTKEPLYAELQLAQADEDQLLAAIALHPVLLERPIVVRGTRAVIARPPEKLLSLFNE
jgi:arsenate reductase